MKKTSFFIGMVAVFFLACQQNKTTPAHQQTDTVNNQAAITEEAPDHEKANPVLLNNGAKWVANTETTEGIKKMEELIRSFPGQAELKEYEVLQQDLETEFDKILKKCTMTGEAHNQLHNYLLPMKEMFEDLDSKDMETCQGTVVRIKQYLAAYPNYFQ